jgi:ribonucleoside-diphosphate reductase alpha chain
VVDEPPAFGGGLSESAALGERELALTNSPIAAAAPAPTTEESQPEAKPVDDKPQATAVAAEPVAAVPEELQVIATGNGQINGHANGNGNGHANGGSAAATPITLTLGQTKVSFQTQADAPSCADCGSIMVRNGSCYKCLNCGSTSGCS